MSKKIKSVSEIISGEKAFDKFRTAAKEQNVIDNFEEIFPDIKNIAVPKKIVKNILIIKVDNSVWRSELNLKKEILAEKINKYFNEELIKTIKFI